MTKKIATTTTISRIQPMFELPERAHGARAIWVSPQGFARRAEDREIVACMKRFAFALALAQLVSTAHASAPREIKLATWNLEWFMKPETLRALAPACTPADAPRDGARRGIPCDVAQELTRSGEDIAAMRRYARGLGADVVALQEVDGAEAARLLFPDYDFCFSSRVAVQNNGFAIRRGLPHACGPELTELSLADD